MLIDIIGLIMKTTIIVYGSKLYKAINKIVLTAVKKIRINFFVKNNDNING